MSRIAYFALKQQLKDAEYNLAAAQAREKARCETGNQYVIDNARLTEQLVVAQADNKMLRDVLERLACLGNGDKHGNSIGNEIAINALAQPIDGTALRAALKAERERIADLFEGQYTDTCPQTNISRAIRAMEDN
jgi:hypothetical protein